MQNSPYDIETELIADFAGGLTRKISASGSDVQTQASDSKTQRKTEQNREAQARFRQKRKVSKSHMNQRKSTIMVVF